jgi:Suv3 C-terminal domain 1
MEYLRQCLSTDIPPIEKAGLLPTTSHIQTFSDTLEQFGLGHGPKNLHNVLLQFNDMASVKSDYFVCKQGAMVKIARVIARLDLSIVSVVEDCKSSRKHQIGSLTTARFACCDQPDKYLLCQCPVSERDASSMDVLKRFAAKLAAGQVAGLTRSMIPKAPKSFDDLSRLCGIFSELELFIWLQRKWPPGNMMEQQTAQALKEQAIQMIAQGLSAVCFPRCLRRVVPIKSEPHVHFLA